jgi:hypothetical protein
MIPLARSHEGHEGTKATNGGFKEALFVTFVSWRLRAARSAGVDHSTAAASTLSVPFDVNSSLSVPPSAVASGFSRLAAAAANPVEPFPAFRLKPEATLTLRQELGSRFCVSVASAFRRKAVAVVQIDRLHGSFRLKPEATPLVYGHSSRSSTRCARASISASRSVA